MDGFWISWSGSGSSGSGWLKTRYHDRSGQMAACIRAPVGVPDAGGFQQTSFTPIRL
ncbi:MAG: hypothetical protein LBF22_01340 [Deltaproteobacteria bacterium]|nr:hypothetical protein [Deltaproteobacteria bacterium]